MDAVILLKVNKEAGGSQGQEGWRTRCKKSETAQYDLALQMTLEI